MHRVHSWFRPVIEAVIEGAAARRRFPPLLTLPCDSRTMKGDANAISWGTDAALLRDRRNGVPVCAEEGRPLSSQESPQTEQRPFDCLLLFIKQLFLSRFEAAFDFAAFDLKTAQ